MKNNPRESLFRWFIERIAFWFAGVVVGIGIMAVYVA